MAGLTARPFAHRGLHGPGRSENGMAAFDAAVAENLGIECDVRLSRDGVAFVFHDPHLTRMTGQAERMDAVDAATLDGIALPDGGSLPRLAMLLARHGAQVPMLIEIKAEGRRIDRLCRAIARELDQFGHHDIAIMSFHPRVVRWFMRQRPGQLRGLVVTQQGKGVLRFRLEQGLALWLSKPDFVACDIRDLPSSLSCRARKKGMPVLSWTIRSQADHLRAAAHADQIIFERDHG